MKISIDRDACEANQVCMRVAPAVFYVDAADHLHLLVETLDDARRAEVEKAVRACPRQALSLVDD
jgi:ferredoxin